MPGGLISNAYTTTTTTTKFILVNFFKQITDLQQVVN